MTEPEPTNRSLLELLLRLYILMRCARVDVWAAEEGVLLLDAFEGTSDRYEKAKSHLDGGE